MNEIRYLEDQGVWLFPSPEGETLEVIVGGVRDAPDHTRVKTMERSIANLSSLRNRAKVLLNEFIDRNKFDVGADWFLVGIESGGALCETRSQISLYFAIEGDTFGAWTVSFQLSESSIDPIAFSRRQV